MRVLITGHLGFVGSATIMALGDRQLGFIGYDLMDGYDVRDAAQLEQVVVDHRPDRILHLAAVARFADADADPLAAHQINVGGTRNVADVSSRHHIPLVYASTGSVYMPITREPPITEDFPVAGNSIYGCTKLVGECYVRRSNAPWIILRYAHLYGLEKRSHGLVGNFVSRIERGLAPTLFGGAQSSDFTYVDDVARANVLALTASHDCWNQVYNIGTGEELSAEQAGMEVAEVWGWNGEIRLMSERRTVDPPRFVYDTSKAVDLLGFSAEYNFALGIREMRRLWLER